MVNKINILYIEGMKRSMLKLSIEIEGKTFSDLEIALDKIRRKVRHKERVWQYSSKKGNFIYAYT